MYHMEYELEQKKKRKEMERQLLDRLQEGLLDGLIGNGFNMGALTSHAFIMDGRPMLVKCLTDKGPFKEYNSPNPRKSVCEPGHAGIKKQVNKNARNMFSPDTDVPSHITPPDIR